MLSEEDRLEQGRLFSRRRLPCLPPAQSLRLLVDLPLKGPYLEATAAASTGRIVTAALLENLLG